ncbi:hypothetical protein BwSF12_77500, partial [Bradyrhizobium ottawaense]
VAVGLGIDDRFGGDIVAGTRLVLDHELLAELFRQALADQPRQDVGGPARRIADHPFHRAGRIIGGKGLRQRGGCKRTGGEQAQRGTASDHLKGSPNVLFLKPDSLKPASARL